MATTPSVPAAGEANTKHRHKKRKISKHVQDSRKTKETAPKRKQKKNRVQKDPSEAANYLVLWKKERSAWKFNKNTQSWLIRHMYEAEKVAKQPFETLLEYLEEYQGKERLVREASRRILRYKEYEKETSENKEASESSEQKESAEPTPEADLKGDEDEAYEQARWKALSDHDKRKEYKRARKVVEVLKS